jgi:16S rRNA (cytidine1402-2'-O)-methyltransferase
VALESADRILCEDTRRTSQLLAAIGVSRPLDRFDAHSGPKDVSRALERLGEGQSLAIVTDAGTPGISDPAAVLVSAARQAGVAVTPIPGPSAVATLLSVSGFNETAFVFRGFFPRKEGEREEELKQASTSPVARVFVWFESPNRIADSLAWLSARVPGAKLVAAKELTKIHERFFSGDAADVALRVKTELEREGEVGEWSFVVEFPALSTGDVEDRSDWVKTLQILEKFANSNSPITASEAARRVSQEFGVPKKAVYDRALELFGKKVSK